MHSIISVEIDISISKFQVGTLKSRARREIVHQGR
jgi:hypothetical protein